MTTFQAVNTSLASVDHAMDHNEETTPTTPRPNMTSIPMPRSEEQPSIGNISAESSQSQNAAGIAGQRPLPTSPFPSQSSVDSGPGALSRGSSLRSTQEGSEENMDIDDDSDEGDDDSQDGGDDGTDGGDSRLSKKKKPQRFFCTDFPPCTLSFTRSEHLARHIRKHTGERPFQCHCARRFSRLDNLRQHAQTVHVNEEIPGDSLAATGTRFQRQIRTDRVRPPGRARAGTGGSQGSHSRGHSRNLSTSSIGSTASNFSQSTEPRRRPPPLIMANDPNARARLNIDTMTSPPSTPPNQYRGFSNHSPGDLSTPTSATFSTGTASPGYGSSIGSPISAASRNNMVWGSRTPGRRLSVPSGQNPFQSPHGNTYPPPYFSPLAPSNASYSNSSSVFTSPTASSYSFARNDSNAAADADWRRRTWHPSTYSNYFRPATSGLSYYQTPDEPQPAFASHATTAASQTPRLPGIESFDHVQHRPSTPPRRGPSPMQVDSASQQPTQPVNATPRGQSSSGPGHHRSHVSWDMSLHSNLTRLDITTGTPPKDAAQWSQQTLGEIQNAASRPYGPSQSESRQVVVHQDRTQSYEQEPTTPRKNKRHGWYNGPFQGTPQTSQALRTSPEDSSSSDGVPTPGISAAEFHPAIMHSNGYIESHHPSMAPEVPQNICASQAPHPSGYRLAPDPRSHAPMQTMPPIQNHDMGRLEALVAVATSEENAATKTF